MIINGKKVGVKSNSVSVGDRFINKQMEYCTVIEYNSARNVVIEFDGYKGYRKVVFASMLKSGEFRNKYKPFVKGVGYIGEGKYNSSTKSGDIRVYNVWKSMLERCCVIEIQQQRPAYAGCTVCDEWYNFQVFAEWYVNHKFAGLGYHIDKDLLVFGNKHYSPDTCCLVPREINNAISSTSSKGVRSRGGRFTARIGAGGKNLGAFSNVEDATRVYIKAKEDYVHSLADKWANRIEWRAYKALMEWKVYPDQV